MVCNTPLNGKPDTERPKSGPFGGVVAIGWRCPECDFQYDSPTSKMIDEGR